MNEKLKEWLKTFNSVQEAADAIGVSKSTIHCWMRGARKPSGFNCMAIEKASAKQFIAEELRPEKFKTKQTKEEMNV